MKLNFEALQERAEAIASEELLESISGGVENACHDGGASFAQFVLDWFY